MANDFSLCWDLDSLNRAYRQGYMAGAMGVTNKKCPHKGEVVEAAWEAGWEDGSDICQLAKPVRKLA